jgi:uncharacterized iron-regulated membrane protein
MTTRLRTILFWCHLVAGVTAGLVILTMSATGVLLMYEKQLIEWSDRGFRSQPPTAGAARLGPEGLITAFSTQRADQVPTAVTLRSDPSAPAAVAIGQQTIYVDAYSGAVLGEPATGIRSAMTKLRSWHRYIAMDGESRATGKWVTGWSNVVFLFIVLSGVVLWIPRIWTKTQLRAVTFFKSGLRGKARDFNWHNVIGLWSAVPLALVVATAMPISFPWANAFVYRLVGETPPQSGARTNGAARDNGARENNRGSNAAINTEGLDAAWARAERQVPGWRSINLRLPDARAKNAVFAIDSGTGGQPQRKSTLTLSAATGDVVLWEPFEAQSPGRRLRSWSRFTHTGEYYGLIGQTIAGLASGGAVVLVWTGLSLAYRRFFGRSARSEARPASTTRSQAA